MLIVLLDEPGLFVFPSPEEAARAIAPVDAEAAFRAAFDDAAVPYRVEWLRPNRPRTGWLRWLRPVARGSFRFAPAGAPDPAALIALLEGHTVAHPPESKTDLAFVLARLRSR